MSRSRIFCADGEARGTERSPVSYPTSADLIAGDLVGLQTGVIWTAICVDYPGHSFEHLGLYFGELRLD